MKSLYKEVYEELLSKVGEEQAEVIVAKYVDMEKDLKFSNLALLSSPFLEKFKFPYTINEFKEQLELLVNFVTDKAPKALDKVKNLINMLPVEKVEKTEDKKPVTSYSWYNNNESKYTTKNNKIAIKEGMKPRSEVKFSSILAVITDFITLNKVDHSIVKDMDDMINYFAQRISDNIAGSLMFTDSKLMMTTSKIKLAAYFNLHTTNKYDIESPELCVSGNKALIELSLYNAFLAGIVRLVSYWKQIIFGRIDKKIVQNRMHYDIIFKAVSCEVDKIVSNYLDKFVYDMAEYQGKTNVLTKKILTEAELLSLEELFVTKLRKPTPRKYANQWEIR